MFIGRETVKVRNIGRQTYGHIHITHTHMHTHTHTHKRTHTHTDRHTHIHTHTALKAGLWSYTRAGDPEKSRLSINTLDTLGTLRTNEI